jgi:hypothetical protein
MTVLTKPTSWRTARPPRETVGSSDLTPEEQRHARAAIRFLIKRHGTSEKLAKAMKANAGTLKASLSADYGLSAGLALRVARVAGVPLEDMLAGRWPSPAACPYCGRE